MIGVVNVGSTYHPPKYSLSFGFVNVGSSPINEPFSINIGVGVSSTVPETFWKLITLYCVVPPVILNLASSLPLSPLLSFLYWK